MSAHTKHALLLKQEQTLERRLADEIAERLASHAIRRNIVHLLAQHPDGLTAEEIHQHMLKDDQDAKGLGR